MKNLAGGLLLIAMCIVCVLVGLHFGHNNLPLLALVPIGAFCGVGGGFLLAGGRER